MKPKKSNEGNWKDKYFVEEMVDGKKRIRGYSVTELINVLIKKGVISESDLE